MRDTPYATLLAQGTYSECRLERLFVKDLGQEEIRFSWWKDGRMINRPLDITENELIELFRNAIRADVFTLDFRRRLKSIL